MTMIFYSISLLKKSNIKDIYIICSNKDLILLQEIFQKEKNIGVNINFLIQKENMNVGALKIFRDNFDFSIKRKLITILGDNLFWTGFI